MVGIEQAIRLMRDQPTMAGYDVTLQIVDSG